MRRKRKTKIELTFSFELARKILQARLEECLVEKIYFLNSCIIASPIEIIKATNNKNNLFPKSHLEIEFIKSGEKIEERIIFMKMLIGYESFFLHRPGERYKKTIMVEATIRLLRGRGIWLPHYLKVDFLNKKLSCGGFFDDYLGGFYAGKKRSANKKNPCPEIINYQELL